MNLLKFLLLLTIVTPTISKKSKNKTYCDANNDTILLGSDNAQNQPLYNSQYRIRVRKLDPLSRTVVIKGVEPKFPLDINADGSSLSSPNRYSNLPIKLHVPIIPIEKSVKIRRIPVIAQNPQRLPLEFNERLFSFAVHVCNLPSLWYLELVFCMHKGVTKFTTGILTSYTLQDIVGSALASMELPNEGFSLSRCNSAVKLFSDIAINLHSKEICNIMMSCLSTKEFLNGERKLNIRKWEKEISKIYKEKPPLFRGQQPRSYAQKIITGLLIAKRNSEEKEKKLLLNSDKKQNFPDKLFYIVRYFNFVMILSEFLISHGYKDNDAFEVSPKDYLKVGNKSLRQKSPLKMIATCARLIINIHILKNSLDYIPYIRKATWTPFSNVIIQHACTKLISIGFINSEIEIPKNISIDELEYLAYPHLIHSSNIVEKSRERTLDSKIDINSDINSIHRRNNNLLLKEKKISAKQLDSPIKSSRNTIRTQISSKNLKNVDDFRSDSTENSNGLPTNATIEISETESKYQNKTEQDSKLLEDEQENTLKINDTEKEKSLDLQNEVRNILLSIDI